MHENRRNSGESPLYCPHPRLLVPHGLPPPSPRLQTIPTQSKRPGTGHRVRADATVAQGGVWLQFLTPKWEGAPPGRKGRSKVGMALTRTRQAPLGLGGDARPRERELVARGERRLPLGWSALVLSGSAGRCVPASSTGFVRGESRRAAGSVLAAPSPRLRICRPRRRRPSRSLPARDARPGGCAANSVRAAEEARAGGGATQGLGFGPREAKRSEDR